MPGSGIRAPSVAKMKTFDGTIDPNAAIDRFSDLIELELANGKLLYRRRQKQLLKKALDWGMDYDEAKRLVGAVVARRGAITEADLERAIDDLFRPIYERGGRIDRQNFRLAEEMYQHLSGGPINGQESQIRIKRMMKQNGWHIWGQEPFGVPRWFHQIPE